jgi:polyhydroxyalkanoate synthesis regulator phasin
VYVNLLIEQDSEGEINPEQEKKIIQLFLNSAGPKYDEIEKIIGRQIPNDIRSIKPLQIIDAKSKKFSNAAVEELAKSHQKILTRIKDILSSKSPQELNTKLGKEIIPIAKGPDLKDKQFKEFLKSFAQDVVKGNQQSKTENKFYDDLAKINENLVDAFKNILGKKDKDDVSLEKLPPEVLEQAKEEYIKNYNNISMQIALEGLKKAYINGFKTRTDPRSSAAIVPELQQKYVELVSQIEAIPILGEKE